MHVHFIIQIGPKGESAGESQDDEGAEEEEEIGHVDDEEDEDMEDERAAGAIGGEEEPWEVCTDKNICGQIVLIQKQMLYDFYFYVESGG